MVLEESGYTQQSEYVNARTKIGMECPEGHSFEILPKHWKKGVRCGVCYRLSLKLKRSVNVTDKRVSNVPQQNTLYDINVTDKRVSNVPQQNTLYDINVKKIVSYFKDFNKNYPSFELTKHPDSNGIIKKVLIHKSSLESMTIWVCKEMMETPNGVMPIYLDSSDVGMDIEYLNEWMIKIHIQ